MDFRNFRIRVFVPRTEGGASGGEGSQPPPPPTPSQEGEASDSASSSSSFDSDSTSSSDAMSLVSASSAVVPANIGSSLIGTPNMQILRCPVCLDFPRRNIYQCSNGHSICGTCVGKTTECCICRVKYGGVRKTRNRLVESLLDTIKLDCEYKSLGCLEKLPRTQMTWHESQCSYNQNAMKLSLLFDDVRGKSVAEKCEVQICPKALGMDSDHANELFDLVYKAPLKIPYREVLRGQRLVWDFPLPKPNGQDSFGPVFLMKLLAPDTKASLGYFALIQRITGDKKTMQTMVSWTILGFTGESKMNRLSHPLITFSIKPFPRNSRNRFGRGSVANLNWFAEAVNLDDWKGFISKPAGERLQFSFAIPESLLSLHYVDESRNCELQFMFS